MNNQELNELDALPDGSLTQEEVRELTASLRKLRSGLEGMASHHILFNQMHGNTNPDCPTCRAIAPLIELVAEEDESIFRG